MKITNLILPIMALTTLNNRTPVFQVEIKDASLSHQLEVKDLDIVKGGVLPSLITPINIKEGWEEKVISHSVGCGELRRSIMNTCDGLTGAKRTACIAVANASYLACIMGGGDSAEVYH